MKFKTRDIVILGTYLALLLSAQVALAWVSGVEIITVLFLSFCYCYGIGRGVFLACAFSLLRCIIFGFYPPAVMLYLIYYNFFAIIVGAVGNAFKHQFSIKILLCVIALCLILTVVFTLLDNLITPLFFKFNHETANAYFYASLPTMLAQLISVGVSVSALFYPLRKALFSFAD